MVNSLLIRPNGPNGTKIFTHAHLLFIFFSSLTIGMACRRVFLWRQIWRTFPSRLGRFRVVPCCSIFSCSCGYRDVVACTQFSSYRSLGCNANTSLSRDNATACETRLPKHKHRIVCTCLGASCGKLFRCICCFVAHTAPSSLSARCDYRPWRRFSVRVFLLALRCYLCAKHTCVGDLLVAKPGSKATCSWRNNEPSLHFALIDYFYFFFLNRVCTVL